MNYYHPWTSDREPKAPMFWGLTASRGHSVFECKECGQSYKLRDEYVYTFTTDGIITLHNREECVKNIDKYLPSTSE